MDFLFCAAEGGGDAYLISKPRTSHTLELAPASPPRFLRRE